MSKSISFLKPLDIVFISSSIDNEFDDDVDDETDQSEYECEDNWLYASLYLFKYLVLLF